MSYGILWIEVGIMTKQDLVRHTAIFWKHLRTKEKISGFDEENGRFWKNL
jgi:hypothetical protein